MGIAYNNSIVKDGLVFAWDGMNSRSWDGSSVTHYDLVSGAAGTKTGGNALTRSNSHVSFSGAGTRVCYLSWDKSRITVPTGSQGTWLWSHYYTSLGNQDHVNIGSETGGSWDGVNGFVFGTGYGTDGPQWGIGGTAYTPYGSSPGSQYRTGVWQIYAVTYQRGVTNGLKTYLLDSNGNRLADQRTPTNVDIGSNTNPLLIGATNSRGGNWNGFMDFAFMYNRALTETEITRTFNALKWRVGL